MPVFLASEFCSPLWKLSYSCVYHGDLIQLLYTLWSPLKLSSLIFPPFGGEQDSVNPSLYNSLIAVLVDLRMRVCPSRVDTVRGPRQLCTLQPETSCPGNALLLTFLELKASTHPEMLDLSCGLGRQACSVQPTLRGHFEPSEVICGHRTPGKLSVYISADLGILWDVPQALQP